MRNQLLETLLGIIVLLSASSARGQAFLGGTPNAFTPQIGVVSTGVVQDVQAVASADRRYVTLNMRVESSNLLALRAFTFQQGNNALGFVGIPPAAANGGNPPAARARQQTPWASARPSISLLQREGMIKISTTPAAPSTLPATPPPAPANVSTGKN